MENTDVSIEAFMSLMGLMKSFCDNVDKLTFTERSAALLIIGKGIDSFNRPRKPLI